MTGAEDVHITIPKGMTVKIDGMPVKLVTATKVTTDVGNSESIYESVAAYESELEDSPGSMKDVDLDEGESKKCSSGDVCGTDDPDPYCVRMVHPGTGEVKIVKARVSASSQSSEVMPSPVAGASFELEKAEAQAAGFVSLADIDSKEMSFLLLSKLNEPKKSRNIVEEIMIAIQEDRLRELRSAISARSNDPFNREPSAAVKAARAVDESVGEQPGFITE